MVRGSRASLRDPVSTTIGHAGRYLFPEIFVGGCALLDMDLAGDLDACLIQAGSLVDATQRSGNHLFRNKGDGSFEDVTSGSGADDRGYGNGVACGDYDDDGDPDIYVTNYGRNTLLRNDGGGRFVDVTAQAGVGHEGWGSCAAFVDFDRDGDLDLFFTNYMHWNVQSERDCIGVDDRDDYCHPRNYRAAAADVLYRNNGDGTFTDVSRIMGFTTSFGNGFGVVVGDFDGNGWLDLFVANDSMPNQCWMNNGSRFQDEAPFRGCAVDLGGIAKAGMGVAAADLDGDDDLDLLVTNMVGESDSFFRNDGTTFEDATAMVGLHVATRRLTRFGVALADFDNDGRLDLFEVSGRVARALQAETDDPYAEPNILFAGKTDGKFHEVEPVGGTAATLIATSRAAAFGDLDNDGGLDVLVANRDGRPHLLRNVAANRGHWVLLRVLEASGRSALGATVRLRVGDTVIRRDVQAAYSYFASNDPRVHVGLGERQQIAEISVQWVDGVRETFGPFAVDRVIELKRGRGKRAS